MAPHRFMQGRARIRLRCRHLIVALLWMVTPGRPAVATQDWLQFKYEPGHSGNVPDRMVDMPLHLLAAVPLTDAVFTAPVVAGDRIYTVDGSGIVHCLDRKTFRTEWTFRTSGGKDNCNNVCSPLLIGRYLHVGTMAGRYYVLDAITGTAIRTIRCGDPIFSTPVAGNGRVYFATLGSRVYALGPNGTTRWTWDFVEEVLGFRGDRWSGTDWLEHSGKATWKEQFCCSRNIALHDRTLVIPAGGRIVWLEDADDHAVLTGQYLGGPRESPSTLGMSLGSQGHVYRQWTRRDNQGRVEILQLRDGTVQTNWVRGTDTQYNGPGLLSFCSVSVREEDVFRCRPEEGLGLCLHRSGEPARTLCKAASICPPILLKNAAVYGGLDGRLYVVPLGEDGETWCFKTPYEKAISAPVAVCDGRVYFGCEDGHLYVLGPTGPNPGMTVSRDLELWRVRSPLSGSYPGKEHDWFTSFGDLANTNVKEQNVAPPFKMKWIRRYEGTVKHFSVCGGGRMYTHTAEGQVFAVEQQSGRLLWRQYFPGVHISYTTALYHQERLYLPQAGLKKCRLRCLDAATGTLLWEAPFSGSPSWNRQQSPIVCKDLVIYLFGTGTYRPSTWLFEHQSTFGFPSDHKPLLRAWNKDTGQEVWTRDFSEYGSGGDDAGMCLMDDVLYYSCYFGNKKTPGVTAALRPDTGELIWVNTQHAVHAGCTVSGKDGRLYLGGYNPVEERINRVWCLDARDGSLVWESEPVLGAIHVITIGKEWLFTHAQYQRGYLIDKSDGRIAGEPEKGYRCTRFTLSEPYLLGANMNIHDLSQAGQLIYAGPTLDVLECVGGFVSNGRLFYTTNGGGLQSCLAYGPQGAALTACWE